MYFIRFFLRSYLPLLISLGFLISLVGLRILSTGTFFYTFLIWNLFLAILPYAITQTALFYDSTKIRKPFKLIVFTLWLLLLPNAPYLITDIIHLHNPHSNWVWFDLFMVFAFACNGLVLYVLSLSDAIELLRPSIPKKWIPMTILVICILNGYGIYLGRFLRFNSWDIIFKPRYLVSQILDSLTFPYVYLMTLAFGLFLSIIFALFRWFKQ
nr:DUF1361 domain-containing protein [uncultured Allomuricauda sp.]